MKIILTESQYERLKKGVDCPYVVRFDFYDVGWTKYGKRKICVDENFFNLIQEYSEQDLETREIGDELKGLIYDYYKKSYYFFPNEIEINYIFGGKEPIVGINYRHKEQIDENHLSHHNINDMPAYNFDKLYGTNISKKYDFLNYTEEEIWGYWLKCRDGEGCHDFVKVFKILPTIFPFISFKDKSDDMKSMILQGMIARFNPFDIVYFAKHGVIYGSNVEQHKLMKDLPLGVGKHLKWVVSPETMQEIKNKFDIV
jgi:hypothetical protein